MEVHHHSHSHGNKNWKSYFWEFLMLFLAIFCGFLAENQREHFVEHRRAKVYATNLYKELQKDTTQLNDLIKWTTQLSSYFDTLCRLSRVQPPVTTGKLYYYSNVIGWARYFSSEGSTMEQLKNSGNLRIMNTVIALKISDYGRRLKSLEDDYSLFKIEYETMNGLRLKIFDGITSSQLFLRRKEAKFRDSVFLLNPSLNTGDPALMKELIGWVKAESDFWKVNVTSHLEPLNNLATEIIALLKKEYHTE